jgi:hypothetical protein
MTRASIAILLLLVTVAAAAENAPPPPPPAPKSPSARAAQEKCDKAIAAADAAYRKAQAEARRQLLVELEASKKDAMKNGNLPEANAIEATIARARDELARAAAAATAAAVELTGTWVVLFNDGGTTRYRFDGQTVSNPAWKVEFERNGSEVRFRTDTDSVRLVFRGADEFSLESWRESPTPFKGKPTYTGTGKRVKP